MNNQYVGVARPHSNLNQPLGTPGSPTNPIIIKRDR